MSPLRWLGRNFGSLLLSFILAVVVWVSAVVTSDPDEESIFQPVSLEVIGQAPDLILVEDLPDEAHLTLRAPRSIWTQLNNNPNLVSAWVDLSGLEAGTHDVPVRRSVEIDPVRVLRVDPETVEVVLESRITQQFPVQIVINGDPAAGHRPSAPSVEPADVTITGPESVVSRVANVRATLDITGATESSKHIVPLEALDQNGDPVSGLTISPRVVTLSQPIILEGGFKTVVVRVITEGQPAEGYRLTNISASPPTVTVFSNDQELVNQMPGYVETTPLRLTGLEEDADFRLDLALPEGVELVGEQSVLVQVSIAPIEGSITIRLPIEAVGLPPELQAEISPPTVDVIVTGPLPVLDTLGTDSFRAVLDLSGLEPGTSQLSPIVDLIPDRVEVQSILPQTVEVTIMERPTPTPTLTPAPDSEAAGTPTPTVQP